MRLEDVVFLEVSDVDAAHDVALLEGGLEGTADPGLLESAVMRPRNDYGVLSLARIAAIYLVGIAKNHAYRDANKRTAFLAAVAFLQLHGIEIAEGPDWPKHVVDAVTGAKSLDDIEALLRISMPFGDVLIDGD